MPEEGIEAPEETQDKLEESSEGTPEETSSIPRSQYEELRSKFNERDEEIRELRDWRERTALLNEVSEDPDEQRQILQRLRDAAQEPYEEEPDEEEYEDPGEIALAYLQQQEQARQAEAEWDQFDDTFEDDLASLREKEGIELTPGAIRYLYHEARIEGTKPEDAFKEMIKDWEVGGKWLSERKSKEAPAPPKGSPGSREEDLRDQTKRREALEREIEGSLSSAE